MDHLLSCLGLHNTVCLDAPIKIDIYGSIHLLAAVSMAEALRARYYPRAEVKHLTIR